MNGLEKETKGAVVSDVRDAKTEKSQKEIQALGFNTHGLVIYDPSDQIKEKIDGHNISEETIREAVAKAIKG